MHNLCGQYLRRFLSWFIARLKERFEFQKQKARGRFLVLPSFFWNSNANNCVSSQISPFVSNQKLYSSNWENSEYMDFWYQDKQTGTVKRASIVLKYITICYFRLSIKESLFSNVNESLLDMCNVKLMDRILRSL